VVSRADHARLRELVRGLDRTAARRRHVCWRTDAKATASGQAKVGNLRTNAGPDSVMLTPNEMASLIGAGIDWNVRKMYDSLRVELQEGKLILHARLDTRALPPGTLGPFAGMFGEREPLRMAGTVSIGKPGTALYDITEISLRGIEIPGPFVKQLTKQMAGASPSARCLSKSILQSPT